MPKDKISSLTLKEKAAMLVGYKTMATFPIPEKGVRSIIMSDGPNGLRIEDLDGDSLSGVSNTKPSTCFPTGVTLASTWNLDLANKMGSAIGDECIHYGVNVVLGPAINIQKNPLCGRNFEYLSEDPILSGKIGSELVKGTQSKGVGACIKHYACNNNEKYRYTGDSILDQRALHEIYLKPFEIVTKESKPYCVMTAYNLVNGVHASEHKQLIEDELRAKWGFDGLVMTDWGGMVHRDISLNNGGDLEMPGMIKENIQTIIDAVEKGTVKEETVDKSVARLLELREKTDIKENKEADFKSHYQLALDIALEGTVLLKNNNLLPLSKKQKYLVIGGLFDYVRYQGSGSSLLNPMILKDHKTAFNEAGIQYDFVLGYKENELEPNKKLEIEALDKAKQHDTIIFYGGLNDYVESEGYDRDNMAIPNNQLSLLDKLTKLGKKIVVVLFGGSPMELPFFDTVDSILDMMLPGEAIGEATTKLLFGECSPSGRLSQTWPLTYEDIPFANEYTSSPYELYKESIFVGYRYFDAVNKPVRFPFGFGLSYTKFKYSNLKIKDGNKVEVSLIVKNVGNFAGKEVVQLYVGKKDSNIVRANKELKGFVKVELKPGEEKEVSIIFDKESLEVFVDDEFKLEDGTYQIYVGASVSDIKLTGEIFVKGESLKENKYDHVYDEFLKTNNVSKEDFESIIGRKIDEYKRGVRP